MSYQDNEYMQRALRLAHKGLYTTTPNPNVGCVIVQQGTVAGEGWHQHAGGPHAEVMALQQAGPRAKNATAYVTLEPCNHTGRTPPCTDALIAAGIGKVFAAMRDPNPLVAGTGLERLRQAGIEVHCGLLEQQARMLNRGFIRRMQQQRPLVRVKMAMSLDGRTALASGVSKWITGEAARHDVQRMRAGSCAILTGIGTVLADDPAMDVRLSASELGIEGPVRQPLRVVLDSQCRISPGARILHAEGDTIVITTADTTNVALGCKIISVHSAGRGVDLAEVMQLLAGLEINTLHVEAGPTLCGSLLQQKLVDELVLYMAPHLLGHEARELFRLPGISDMQHRIELEISDIRSVGKDIRITAAPLYK